MSKILDWIKRHIWQTILIGLAVFFVPLIFVHVAYRISAVSPWFASTWEAGELITYIAGFEAFLGTVALGFATVYLNANANSLSSSLLQIEEKRSKYDRQPVLEVNKCTAKIDSLIEILTNNNSSNSVFLFETPPSKLPFEQYKREQFIYLSFEVKNTGHVPIFINLQELTIKNYFVDEEKSIFLLDLSDGNPTVLFRPDSSILYEFAILRDDFFKNNYYYYKFVFTLTNVINETSIFELLFSGVVDSELINFHLSSFDIATKSQ